MYYENNKEKKKERLVFVVFMTVVITLLIILIWKTDANKMSMQTNYDANKTSISAKDENGKDIQNNYEASQYVFEKEETLSSDIIEKAVKSVVGISKLEQNGTSIFLENSESKLGLGSGIIVTDNGYILTNQHVAGNKYSNCNVTLENGKTFDGTVVWADSNIDLAIVKIAGSNLDYISLADSDNIRLAEEVYAIGNPIGIEFQRTVTKGIISGKNRTIKLSDDENSSYMEDLIQTDATINEGNSGGALINSRGELIGVNSVKISDAEGIGFAVPINIVKPIIERLVKEGKFDEAYLGIYGYDKEVIPYLDSSLNIESGVYIAKIMPDGPLNNSGFIGSDIITKVDDTQIYKMNDLKKYIYTKRPGDAVKLIVRRKNEELTLDIKLGNKI